MEGNPFSVHNISISRTQGFSEGRCCSVPGASPNLTWVPAGLFLSHLSLLSPSCCYSADFSFLALTETHPQCCSQLSCGSQWVPSKQLQLLWSDRGTAAALPLPRPCHPRQNFKYTYMIHIMYLITPYY